MSLFFRIFMCESKKENNSNTYWWQRYERKRKWKLFPSVKISHSPEMFLFQHQTDKYG